MPPPIDWDEVRALLVSNVRPSPTPLAPGVLLPSPPDTPARDTGVAFAAVSQRLLQPLLRNAYDKGPAGDRRVLAIRANQPWLVFAMDHVLGAAELLAAAGFTNDGATFALPAGIADQTAPHGAVERLQSALETLSLATEDIAKVTASALPPASSSLPTAATAARAIQSRVNRSAEEAAKEALKAAIRRDHAEREAEKRRDAASEAAHAAGAEADAAEGKPLLEVAKRTIHFTGRLRNTSFEGEGFTIRTMRHGRHYACGDAECTKEGAGLEVHWHLYSGLNMMYCYVAHLSPDASTVLHVGAEIGYQYNTMPHTENFQKTVMTRRVRMTREGGLLDFSSPNAVATKCEYCGVAFEKLWK